MKTNSILTENSIENLFNFFSTTKKDCAKTPIELCHFEKTRNTINQMKLDNRKAKKFSRKTLVTKDQSKNFLDFLHASTKICYKSMSQTSTALSIGPRGNEWSN